MEELSNTSENAPQSIPKQETQPVIPAQAEIKGGARFNKKIKDFCAGLFFSLTGAAVLTLLDLLFIAKVNSEQNWLLLLLVFLGPLMIIGLQIFFWIYFFKRQRFLFWGLLAGFFVFISLFSFILKILAVPFGEL